MQSLKKIHAWAQMQDPLWRNPVHLFSRYIVLSEKIILTLIKAYYFVTDVSSMMVMLYLFSLHVLPPSLHVSHKTYS